MYRPQYQYYVVAYIPRTQKIFMSHAITMYVYVPSESTSSTWLFCKYNAFYLYLFLYKSRKKTFETGDKLEK